MFSFSLSGLSSLSGLRLASPPCLEPLFSFFLFPVPFSPFPRLFSNKFIFPFFPFVSLISYLFFYRQFWSTNYYIHSSPTIQFTCSLTVLPTCTINSASCSTKERASTFRVKILPVPCSPCSSCSTCSPCSPCWGLLNWLF